MRMKMTKKLLILTFMAALIPSFTLLAAGRQDGLRDLTIYGIRGSSGLALLGLFDEPPQIEGFTVRMEALANADLMAARLISGEAIAGILPPNMAAKIASSGIDIRVIAVTGTGMLSLLSTDPQIRTINDLRGRDVYVVGQGATPDFVFRRILNYYRINPENDLNLHYSLSPPEIAQSLIAGRISTALLPEPFATMALMGRADISRISDIQEEWIRSSNTNMNYPMTLFVVQGSFIDANPGAMDIILNDIRRSIEFVIANPVQAGILAERHELGIGSAIAASAIPNSGYVFIPARDARTSLEELFSLFLEYDPISVGGELPGDLFYYR